MAGICSRDFRASSSCSGCSGCAATVPCARCGCVQQWRRKGSHLCCRPAYRDHDGEFVSVSAFHANLYNVMAIHWQEDEGGWWNGRVGDLLGVLPSTYIDPVTTVIVKFRWRACMNSRCAITFKRVLIGVGASLLTQCCMCQSPRRQSSASARVTSCRCWTTRLVVITLRIAPS